MRPSRAESRPGAGATAGQGPRRWAGALLIITSVLWLHEWFPALFAAAFVVWLVLHNRLEGDLGNVLLHMWRRVWPPPSLVLFPLLVAGAAGYWISGQPIARTMLPLALNLVGLSLLIGGWGRSLLRRDRFPSLTQEISHGPVGAPE